MDDTVRGALIGVIGTILGVAATMLFTLLHDRVREQRERQGIRTLLSVEILQNATALLVFHKVLETTLDYDDAKHITAAFLVTAVPPHWEKSRWNAPETGRYLTSAELLRIGEWYTKLDSATFLYERLMEQLRHLPAPDGKLAINVAVGTNAVQQIRGLLEYAEELRKNPPPLPDAKLNSGESVREYLDDLQRRQPEAEYKPDTPDKAGL